MLLRSFRVVAQTSAGEKPPDPGKPGKRVALEVPPMPGFTKLRYYYNVASNNLTIR